MPRHDSIQLTEVSLVPSVPLRQHRSSTIHVITSSSTRFCTCKSFKWNEGELRAHPRERRSLRISCYTLTWLMASTNMLRRQLEATVIVPQSKQLQNVYIDHYIWPASLIKILSEIKTVATDCCDDKDKDTDKLTERLNMRYILKCQRLKHSKYDLGFLPLVTIVTIAAPLTLWDPVWLILWAMHRILCYFYRAECITGIFCFYIAIYF